MNSYIEALRLERWPRSTAIFLGSLAYLFLATDKKFLGQYLWSLIWKTSLAFLLTWGISTVNYVINEIADAPYDRHHPVKKNRPLASGRIKKGPFIFIGIILGLVCFFLAWLFFPWTFLIFLLTLLLAGFFYNVPPFRSKDIPFLDSISESANNPIRFLIGWYALAGSFHPFPSPGLLLAWWAFGNFLMVAKRLSELRWLKEAAGLYRQSLLHYTPFSLMIGLSLSALVFFAGYIWFCLEKHLKLWLFYIPLLIIYFLLFLWKTLAEKAVMEEPEKLFRRPLFAFYSLGLGLLFLISLLL